MTPQLAKGIICHSALEEVFDLKPEERSLFSLENLFRREWGRLRGNRDNNALGTVEKTEKKTKEEQKYDSLFRKEHNDIDADGPAPYDIESEIEWGKSAIGLLRNYFIDLEDPRTVKAPNPLMTEMWVTAQFTSGDIDDDTNQFIVKGKIDRIDMLSNSSNDKVQLQIIDYKTGKKPWFKYSKSVNERIKQEQFWKMKVYALLLWKMMQETDGAKERVAIDSKSKKDQWKYGLPWMLQQKLEGIIESGAGGSTPNRFEDVLELSCLRLAYLTSNLNDESVNDPTTAMADKITGKATYLDHPLGSPSEFQSLLEQTDQEVQAIAKNIKTLVDLQDPLAFEHCDWSYCSCHEIRRRFVHGSVYQCPELDY